MSIKDEIMNLPAKYVGAGTEEGKYAYVAGYKDARHAAAELAAKLEGELVAAIRSLLQMPSTCIGDDEILENNRRRAAARRLVSAEGGEG